MSVFTFEFDWLLFLPFVLGFARLGAYIWLKYIPSLFYRPYVQYEEINDMRIDPNENVKQFTKKDVTYVVPLYMFDPDFEKCLVSWLRNGPKKINLVSDATCYQDVVDIVEKTNTGDYYTEVNVINETMPGKRAALYSGYLQTDTEIICFVDDDVFHHDGFLDNLILPFNDKNKLMGGVSSKQVARPKINKGWNMWDVFMDMRLFQRMVEIKATTAFGGGSTCLSGRTMCYRKAVFDEQEDFEGNFLKETFNGALQLSGDDKCLTRMVINSKYDMYHQVTSKCCLTTKFEDPPVLFKQIMRWNRNTWRSDFKLLFAERNVWCKYPFLAIVMLDRFISPFSMWVGPFLISYAFIYTRNAFVLVAALAYLMLTRSIKMIPYFVTDRPRRPLWWVCYLPFFIIFQYYTAFLKIWALFTLKNRKWGNREVKVNKNNEIVRTQNDPSDLSEVKVIEYKKNKNDEERVLDNVHLHIANDEEEYKPKLKLSDFPEEADATNTLIITDSENVDYVIR
jgi:cellulose synthase/poly-beta-1,6-N-acetylglucosamine synthase-like glycosyltransferase